MALSYYYKIGLLVLNENRTRFLVCEKSPEDTSDYIMPGGKFIEPTIEECLRNEIREELNCAIDMTTLRYVGAYTDVAAGRPDRDVTIELYSGVLIGTPVPSSEVRALHWIGRGHADDPRLSPIVRNKILPDLVHRKMLL